MFAEPLRGTVYFLAIVFTREDVTSEKKKKSEEQREKNSTGILKGKRETNVTDGMFKSTRATRF